MGSEMGGVKVTVTLNKEIYRALRKLQGAFIQATMDDWSLTSVMNTILLAGIIAVDYLDPKKEKEFWEKITSFIRETKQELEIESMTDKAANMIIKKIFGEEERTMPSKQKKGSSNLTM